MSPTNKQIKKDNARAKKNHGDGLVNVATGLGTERSKRSQNHWQYDLLLAWQELEAAYTSNWIARQIVQVPAQDMIREWRRIKSDHAEEIAAEEQRLCLFTVLEESITWARLFGGAGILMLTGQDLTKPLNVNRIKKGDLKRMLVFDRWDMNSVSINTWDVLAENYLCPEFYTVRGGTQQIHHSHFARFLGAKLPRRLMAYTQGWGDSELRKCIEDVNDTVAAKGGISELMQEANVDVIKRKGLDDALAADEDDELVKRYSVFGLMKSSIHLSLLDDDEEYERHPLELGGVAPVIEQLMIWVAGAARIPVTKLFGTSAKGLNATGEGDLKTYYDDIKSMQQSDLSIPLRTIDEVMVRSAIGFWPEDFDYDWNPLSQPSQTETAQAQLLNAQRDALYLENNVVQRVQVMRGLQSQDVYVYDDSKLDELDALTESDMFEELPPAGDAGDTPPSPTPAATDDDSVNNGYVSVRPFEDTALEIAQHVSSLGIMSPVPAPELHCTVMHSSSANIGTDPQPTRQFDAEISAPCMMLGNALVAPLKSPSLMVRYSELYAAGGVHDQDEYIPHITLKYDATPDDLAKLQANPLPQTRLTLSHERMASCQ